MSNDKFLEILVDEYSEQIIDIILSNYGHSGRSLNFSRLNQRLQSLRIDHASSTLSEDEWYELIYELTPDVYDEIYYGRKAA
ncbi:MAG: hypothetical protein VYA54_09605 [Bdellovibrionota bacterium]|nr:hypothetical protein [Bdellovibrionota bacterium]